MTPDGPVAAATAAATAAGFLDAGDFPCAAADGGLGGATAFAGTLALPAAGLALCFAGEVTAFASFPASTTPPPTPPLARSDSALSASGLSSSESEGDGGRGG